MDKKIIVVDVKWFTKQKLERINKSISTAVNPLLKNNIICAASNINIGTDSIIIRKNEKDTVYSMFKRISKCAKESRNVVFVVSEFHQLQCLIGIEDFSNIIIAYEPYNKKMVTEEYKKNINYLQVLFEKMFGLDSKQKVTFICAGRMVEKNPISFTWTDGILLQYENIDPIFFSGICNTFLQ